MLVFDIAEWIANIFILGIAFVIWMGGILLFMMIISIAMDKIKTLKM
jgi:hypothetical protein